MPSFDEGDEASASRKRKAPPGNGATRAAAPTNKGVDTLLTIRSRPLAVGESVGFRLIKGASPTEPSGDPVDGTAPLEKFPLIAKFGESVVRPVFTKEPWHSARLYQQEIPKPVDDSDGENEQNGEGKALVRKKRWKYGSSDSAPRQWILQENIEFLQTMIERKEQQQQQKLNGGIGSTEDHRRQNGTSSRYEGVSEHNTSLYALVRLHPSTTSPQDASLEVCLLPSDRNCTINFSQPAARKAYSLTEAEHLISDQRMGLVKTLHHMQPTASSAPGSGGNGGKGGANDLTNGSHAGGDGSSDHSNMPAVPRPNILALRKKAAQSSKGRLLNRLQAKSKSNADNEEEDGDDVMADVTFKNRKGGGMARKELLSTIGEGIYVSDEGVLGGSNDAMFGGRERFAQLAAGSNTNESKQERGGEEGVDPAGDTEGNDARGLLGQQQQQERGADGAAMDDDFYQRDVKAEYDELDYDANEQFDDDDVDLGEGEVVADNSDGLNIADELDEELEEEEEEDEDSQGAVGLASLAGFQALLAKARGETPPDAGADGATNGGDGNESAAGPGGALQPNAMNKKSSKFNQQIANKNKNKLVDHMSKIMAAAEKSQKSRLAGGKAHDSDGDVAMGGTNDSNVNNQTMENDSSTTPAPAVVNTGATTTTTTTERDANGLRILSLEAMKREIWLKNGSISMKRLTKIFDVKSKSPQERRDKFFEIVKELCIMQSDPIQGRLLVLKQHYAKG